MRTFGTFFYVLATVILVFAFAFWSSCSQEKTIGETCLTLSSGIARSPGEIPGQINYETYSDLRVPPLPPDEALEKFQLEEGFRIELVAHEPMVTDPVAMDIDADGRLWIVDMPSYMPVADMGDWETAIREQVPKGRIVVLEDTTGDGVMDKFRIFRENLILPRAIKVLNDGVLVGEPPNVWFIRDTNGDGKGDTRELVYDTYGDPNVTNVESLPNGLMWGMDNWIHSVDSGAESLRRINGRWEIRPFERLGQWGLTQDNWGRLFSANNTRPLQTHLVPFGYSNRHPMFDLSTGINASIAPNEPMWPAHAVGSNRSYRIGQEVREDGTLLRATSTLGPVIYRGHQFGDEYNRNNRAFTPEPAANMIKHLILEGDPANIEAEAHFAYEGREFLTSTDERFRPVNMYNSPDGTLYVVDMYRGVIQHARFLTDHLRDYIIERDLHIPVGKFGRIYRIVREDREIETNTPRFSQLKPAEVVDYLRHENGFLRDQAQQILVQCSPAGVVTALEEMVKNRNGSEKDQTRLHALWSLEGFNRSAYAKERLTGIALQALEDSHPRIRAAAIRILEPEITQNSENVLNRLEKRIDSESSSFVQLQLLASLGESGSDASLKLIADLLNRHAENPYFREMALTGVYKREKQFADLLRNGYGWNNDRSDEAAEFLANLDNAETADNNREPLAALTGAQRRLHEHGNRMYVSCSACHGTEGEGVSGIGPALAGSHWVQEDPEAIVRILLHGFEGGVAENPRTAVNISGVMPAHAFLSDEELAGILTYIRKSWGNDAAPIEPEEVARIRSETDGRTNVWTPGELRKLMD